ncbi:MAG: hypothetical protein ACE5GD_06400 [Candidatus Geothermarchaeales archaeon]
MSFNDVKDINIADKTLTITHGKRKKASTLMIEFINAEEARDAGAIITKRLEEIETLKKRINDLVTTINNVGLASDAAFSLALSLDKKCNWQKTNEEYERLVDKTEALSSKGLNLDKKIVDEIEKEVRERDPERVKELILDFVKNLHSAVNEVKESGPPVEISPSWRELKQFTEFLLLVEALGLVLRRGLRERADDLRETISVKLSELEPFVDKKYVDKIERNIKSNKHEVIAKIPASFVKGIKAKYEKLSS